MKKSILYIAVCAALTMTACGNRQTGNQVIVANDSVQTDSIVSEAEDTYFTAIDRYLVDSISIHYSEADIHVPLPSVVAVDEKNADDILVWGDFWVMNYNQVGDTLKMVSGGSHPGLMHIRQTEHGFEVTAFDQVGDGSLFEKSAKKIFGDKFDSFMKVYSDHMMRNQHQEELLSEYVRKHGLTATMYQEYGRPAVTLKK